MDGEPPSAKRLRSDNAPPGVEHERELLGRSITDALLQASSLVLKEYMPDVTAERQARPRGITRGRAARTARRSLVGTRGSSRAQGAGADARLLMCGPSAQVVLLAVANMASTVVELVMPTIQVRSHTRERACSRNAGLTNTVDFRLTAGRCTHAVHHPRAAGAGSASAGAGACGLPDAAAAVVPSSLRNTVCATTNAGAAAASAADAVADSASAVADRAAGAGPAADAAYAAAAAAAKHCYTPDAAAAAGRASGCRAAAAGAGE